jgi:hypothetical protein
VIRFAPLLATFAIGCGEPQGAAIARKLREDLASTLPSKARGPDKVDVPDAAWLTTDPVEVQLTAESGIRIEGRSRARGGAGVLVRWDGGAFRVRVRVRVERMDFGKSLASGLFALGGCAGLDPELSVLWQCEGGEGAIRHTALLRSVGDGERSSPLGDFQLGASHELEFAVDSGSAEAAFLVPPRTASVSATRMPDGLYVLGACPCAGDVSGGVSATITIVAIEGGLKPVPCDVDDVPPYLRGGEPDPGLAHDPLAEAARLVAAATRASWEVTAARVRELSNITRSLFIDERASSQPELGAWLDAAAVRYANEAERQARMVEPMIGEMSRVLSLVAPHPDRRGDLDEWARGLPDSEGVPRSVQQAATRYVLAALSGAAGFAAYEESLQACPCDWTAWQALDDVGPADPGFHLLERYALEPHADARLAVAVAERQLWHGDRKGAMEFARSALERGVCDQSLFRVLEGLGDPALSLKWWTMRADAPAVLKAVLERQRWMGLGKAAAATGRALLAIEHTEETARLVAPVFLLGREEKDERRLTELLADPLLAGAARQGLQEDRFLARYRQQDIDRLIGGGEAAVQPMEAAHQRPK